MTTKDISPKVLATHERVDFPEFGLTHIMAKIDTGAYTGAFHCESIQERIDGDYNTLVFVPLHSQMPIEKEEFAIRYVRSSNGTREKRYFVATQIIVLGNSYRITLSLANRSEMKWPVLIGRRFLKRHGFLVDPSRKSYHLKQARKII